MFRKATVCSELCELFFRDLGNNSESQSGNGGYFVKFQMEC